ncbi:hypothetical protein KUCAC02_004684, partial [Chaenocephalus aceratus]
GTTLLKTGRYSQLDRHFGSNKGQEVLHTNWLQCEGRAPPKRRPAFHPKVMTETTIQLPEVNVATVTQWFSRRCRSQGEQVLKQGIPAPDAPMAGPEQLLVAKQKGTSLLPGSLAEPHTFVLPPNTAVSNKNINYDKDTGMLLPQEKNHSLQTLQQSLKGFSSESGQQAVCCHCKMTRT